MVTHCSRARMPLKAQDGAFYIHEVEWGEMNGNFWGLPAGFDSGPMFEHLPRGCECPHWGYLFRGRMTVKYADHEEHITAGEAYYLAPGHNVVVEEDCEMVEFSPKELSRKMMQIAAGQSAAK